MPPVFLWKDGHMSVRKHAGGKVSAGWFARLRGNRKAMALAVASVVVLVVALSVLGYMLWVYLLDQSAAAKMADLDEPSTSVQATPADGKASPVIDFASLQSQNPEIYAWLYVPGTGVNMPLVQHTGDSDEYYLSHDAYGRYSPLGAAFSQGVNSPSFTDPVTVVYGHDVKSVFRNLHYFERSDFFRQHDRMYVYLPNGKLLTYTIVSAYRTDNSYILGKYDMNSEQGRRTYYREVTNPSDRQYRQVRKNVSLGVDDRILQLSTCMLNEVHGSHRYIVTGVLTSEQQQIQ